MEAELDLGGICLPAQPGLGVDRLRAEEHAVLAERALKLVQGRNRGGPPTVGPLLDLLEAALVELPGCGRVTAFGSELAHAHLHEGLCSEDPLASALGVVRFLLGAPDLPEFFCVLPEEAFPPGGLYLPHLHARLEPGQGPVAVEVSSVRARLTWTDGVAATLPVGGVAAAGRIGDKLQTFSRVGEWRVLNGLPELDHPLLRASPPVAPAATGQDLAVLEAGVQLLGEVWPEALAAGQRFFTAVCFQPPLEDHTTSFTLAMLQGCFMASMRDPVQAADAICHEGSHTRLAIALGRDPLLRDDGAEVHPSPWRTDPRPLKGLLNGVHAFVNVCHFYRRLSERQPERAGGAESIYEEQRARVLEAWAYLEPRATPTRAGETFMAELAIAVEGL